MKISLSQMNQRTGIGAFFIVILYAKIEIIIKKKNP